MIMLDQATDPAVHELCCKLADRCTWVIRACLRGENRQMVAREFYSIARELIDKPSPPPEV